MANTDFGNFQKEAREFVGMYVAFRNPTYEIRPEWFQIIGVSLEVCDDRSEEVNVKIVALDKRGKWDGNKFWVEPKNIFTVDQLVKIYHKLVREYEQCETMARMFNGSFSHIGKQIDLIETLINTCPQGGIALVRP